MSSASSPNKAAIKRLIGAVLKGQNDEWQTQNRYMQIEGFAESTAPAIDQAPVQITPVGRLTKWLPQATAEILYQLDGRDRASSKFPAEG